MAHDIECDKGAVYKRYHAVANDADHDFFATRTSRSPYRRGERMGRGADYYETFKSFTALGGLGTFKNAVVMNVRMNFVGNLVMLDECFSAEFFLDLAYWVPRFDQAHHKDPKTVGKFAEFEPHLDLPEALEYSMATRTSEFSKNPGSRKHECQLGQNAETPLKVKGGVGAAMRRSRVSGGAASFEFDSSARPPKLVARVSDKASHWPRLWRTLASDGELKKVSLLKAEGTKAAKEQAKALEPTNESPENVPKRLKELFEFLDAQRELNLNVTPEEGIVFCSYDVRASIRQTYDLHLFPYDFQELSIKVRLFKAHHDPLVRHIVPLAHDKAFFCSGRVPPLTEWDISKNLDWEVELGASGDPSRDGGKQRLVAKVIVKRKHFYYTAHYVLIIFLIVSSVFTVFTFDAGQQLEARAAVVFSLLLTVVQFQYITNKHIPKVSYPTVLDSFVNLSFVVILIVGGLTAFFTFAAYQDQLYHNVKPSTVGDGYPRHNFKYGSIFMYRVELSVSLAVIALWMGGNAYYWYGIHRMLEHTTRVIDEDEQLGWLHFKRRLHTEERKLIDANAEHGDKPLNRAAREGHTAKVKKLLEDITPKDLNHRTQTGNTALASAAREGYLDVVTLLLDKGARADIPNKDGNTPRDCAILFKNENWRQVLELLDARNPEGRAPGKLDLPP